MAKNKKKAKPELVRGSKARIEAGKKAITAVEGAEFPELTIEEMEALLSTLKKNEKLLRNHKGVYKVDVGYAWRDGKMTGEVAIRAHVKRKKPEEELGKNDIVPKEIDGLPIDVIESNIERHPLTRRNPLVGGVETRNVNLGGRGTLGAVVFNQGDYAPMALSNRHVYVADRPNGAAGDRVNQPGTTSSNDTVGAVMRSNAALDCAVAALNNSRQVSTSVLNFEGGIKGVRTPVIGAVVTKSGRTTGTTLGMIEGVNANDVAIVPIPGDWQEISSPGDSGSIWLERTSHAAVGLHWGGETSTAPADERAWAKNISRVANRLNIELCRKSTLSETSTNGPALTTKGNQLLLGWVGTGNLFLNFLSSTDGLTFSQKVTLGETSSDALSLTVFRNKFVVAWIGVGNRRLNVMQSTDGRTWTKKVTLGDTSTSSPVLTTFRGHLYIAWRGVGNNRLNVMRSTDGIRWVDKVTLGDTTTSGPALTSTGPRLLLGWRGVGNNRLNVLTSTNGTSFQRKVTLGETTTSRPYLHFHGRKAFLAWQGVGNRSLNVLSSGTGSTWSGKIILRETCIDGPCLGTLGNDFVWSWTGTDQRHRLNTLLYDLRV
jgi:hypothetical protein